MKILLIGAPGSGKGTQAKVISKELGIPHISTGDLIRGSIAAGDPYGLTEIVNNGKLISMQLTLKLFGERASQPDCNNGFILDGFPRTLEQAEETERLIRFDKIIYIKINKEKVLNRLLGRRICKECGTSFHIDTYKKDKCENCGGDIIQRIDDDMESIVKRFNVFDNETMPVIRFYENDPRLLVIDGDQSIEKVSEDILEAIKK